MSSRWADAPVKPISWPLVEDRHHDRHVRGVRRPDVRVVVQDAVALVDVVAEQADDALHDRLAAVELARRLVLRAHDVLAHVAVAGVAEHAVGQHDQQASARLEQLQAAVDEEDRWVGVGGRVLPNALAVGRPAHRKPGDRG